MLLLRMKRMFSAAFIAGIMIAIALFSAAETLMAKEAKGKEPPAMGGIPVETTQAVIETIPTIVESVGTLLSSETVSMSTEIDGKISAISFLEGQQVQKNQLLISLDDAMYQAERKIAQANLQLSQARLSRAQGLYKKNLGSKEVYDETLAAIRKDEASLSQANEKLSKTRITAPFTGIVGLRNISVGDYVQPGMTLVNLEMINPLKVDFQVPEQFLPSLQNEAKILVTVDVYPEKEFTGKVYAMDPKINENSRGIKVRAIVENPEGLLRPGNFARIKLVLHETSMVVIPEKALVKTSNSNVVYVVEEGKAKVIPVSLGPRYKEKLGITLGLNGSEEIITAGQLKLQEGAPVMKLPEPEKPANVSASSKRG